MSLCPYVLLFAALAAAKSHYGVSPYVSLKKKLGIAKVICKPLVLVPKTAQESSLSKLGEMAHV